MREQVLAGVRAALPHLADDGSLGYDVLAGLAGVDAFDPSTSRAATPAEPDGPDIRRLAQALFWKAEILYG